MLDKFWQDECILYNVESFDDNINEQLSSSSTQCDNTEDGGYGWLVVFAAFTFSFSTIGRNLSWYSFQCLLHVVLDLHCLYFPTRGVYQDIIQRQSQQEALDNVHYPQATLSLVGTLGILFTQFGSVLVTWKSHLTHIKTILLSATLLQCGGLVGAASATRASIHHFTHVKSYQHVLKHDQCSYGNSTCITASYAVSVVV